MKAYQLLEWQSQPQLVDVDVPEPGPGEVLVRIGGAGACHSDLHVMEWPEGTLPWRLPFTLGHENAGWVESVGAGVCTVEPGQPVAVYGPWGCGTCRACRLSKENYCLRAAEIPYAGGGLGADGGMRLAQEVGADEAVRSGEGAGEEVRRLTGGAGAQVVLDFVGAEQTMALAMACASVESHVTVVGLGGGSFAYAYGAVPWEASLAIPYWGSQAELMEVLELARAGAIRPHVERFPLERVGEAYEKMRRGELRGRAVITP